MSHLVLGQEKETLAVSNNAFRARVVCYKTLINIVKVSEVDRRRYSPKLHETVPSSSLSTLNNCFVS